MAGGGTRCRVLDLLRPDALDVVSPGEDCGLPSCGRAEVEYPRMPLADWKDDIGDLYRF